MLSCRALSRAAAECGSGAERGASSHPATLTKPRLNRLHHHHHHHPHLPALAGVLLCPGRKLVHLLLNFLRHLGVPTLHLQAAGGSWQAA